MIWGVHLPEFDFFLIFIEKQLKLVSHPIINNSLSSGGVKSKDADNSRRPKAIIPKSSCREPISTDSRMFCVG